MIKRKYAYMRIDDYNIDFEDVENTITYSLSAKNLENNLNKREEELCNKIADLEAKLAESESELVLARNTSINTNKMEILHLQIENEELKQQLEEKEKEIESLRENSLSKRIFKEKLIPSHCMEQYEKYEQQIDKLTQDKISFAIEQLEKVKEIMSKSNESGYIVRFASMNDRDKFNETIDNQIKELKGKVEE